MKRQLIFILMLFLGAFVFPKNVIGQFAELIHLEHSCTGQGGVAKFELIGDPSIYTYHWLPGGEETLSLANMVAGSYSFVVQSVFGCEEQYDVEILDLTECTMIHNVSSIDLCYKKIDLQVYNNGQIMTESELNIQWSDGVVGGLSRTIYSGQSGTGISVSITGNGNNANCCSVGMGFLLPGNPECIIKEKCKVIVNEFDRGSSNRPQFVELFVRGTCVCEEKYDIRGYYIDDNNGLLIPGGESIHSGNSSKIGVDSGFLAFAYNEQWKSIPNGSLIVIYEPGLWPDTGGIPDLDPTDANEDGVYVLLGNDSNYFYANAGSWDNQNHVQNYEGNFIDPSWDAVRISPKADGMQVRNPDGTYFHGVSLGTPELSVTNVTNEFPLWITGDSYEYCNCQFKETDHTNKEHFHCVTSANNERSPGLPNSISNKKMIASLRSCRDRNSFASKGRPGEDEGINPMLRDANKTKPLVVSPNPFEDKLHLEYSSPIEGTTEVLIYSPSGKLILAENWESSEGNNRHAILTAGRLDLGLLLLRFTYPDGTSENMRIVHRSSK